MFETFAVLFAAIFFGIPFYFVIINSFKNSADAAKLSLAWPEAFQFFANYKEVLTLNDGVVLRAFLNSSLITIASIIIIIFICSMAGFVLSRRQGMAKKTQLRDSNGADDSTNHCSYYLGVTTVRTFLSHFQALFY